MTVLLIILVLVLIGLWKFGKFETVSNGIKNIWNRAGSSAPPAPGTATPPAPGTPAAQPLWKRWAWPVGIIVVILALANASVREALWTTGAPAVHSWTTGAKTFDVTVTSSNTFEIGTIRQGQWTTSVSRIVYWCTTADGTVYRGMFSGSAKIVDANAAKMPALAHTALLITTKHGMNMDWRSPGETILSTEGDTVYGTMNVPDNCTMVKPNPIQVTFNFVTM